MAAADLGQEAGVGVRTKCAHCGHVGHGIACRAKGPSKCVPLVSEIDGMTGFACGVRPPCPCPWRLCQCGAPVALAAQLPRSIGGLPVEGEVVIVSVERGSAGDPAGRLAVRELAGGYLACRDLAGGEPVDGGEWRGREHLNEACPLLARAERNPRWLTLRGAA